MILGSQDKQTYSFSVTYNDGYGEWGGTLQLSFRGSVGEVSEFASEFESSAHTAFVIASANEPDPRLSFDVFNCPGAPLSRLKIGKKTYIYGSFNDSGPTLFDRVGGTSIGTINFLIDFQVVDGPECHDSQVWWKISTGDGKTGWVSEHMGHDYQIYSTDATPPIPPFQNGT